jgi:hypothetical protein
MSKQQALLLIAWADVFYLTGYPLSPACDVDIAIDEKAVDRTMAHSLARTLTSGYQLHMPTHASVPSQASFLARPLYPSRAYILTVADTADQMEPSTASTGLGPPGAPAHSYSTPKITLHHQ